MVRKNSAVIPILDGYEESQRDAMNQIDGSEMMLCTYL